MVELREGQTLAIAGLLQLSDHRHHRSDSRPGRPAARRALVQHNHIETVETETIILVTPELVAPLEKNEVTEAPGDRVYQPNDAEFYFLGRIEGKLGREFRATMAEQGPAQPDEAFPERAAVGHRPPRLRRLTSFLPAPRERAVPVSPVPRGVPYQNRSSRRALARHSRGQIARGRW